jgi:hypothetical protein
MMDYDDDLIYDGLNGNEYKQDEYQEQFKWSSEIIYYLFIPKKDSDFRPISIQETILLVFHKILTQELRS